MRKYRLLIAVAPFALITPALAETVPANTPETAPAAAEADADAPAPAQAAKQVFSTGVAKGRDLLDSAISTSSLRADEIGKLGARSVAEILRDIPGIRSEANIGEGGASISIRGLPIASSGTKFVQIQEDGLPILEFGDIVPVASDSFLRADLNLAQVEVIRGGSASTFASNSPGGLINFQSQTGETEGGAIQASVGLDYGEYRTDFAYGAKISDTLRFHIGGFYRQGEGPRRTGYDAAKGGQIKLNVTKDFDGGYIRLYGKYLDDRSPVYDVVPMRVTGTDANPKFANIANFDANGDTLFSRHFTRNLVLDGQNNVAAHDMRDGAHAQVKSVGLESQFDLGGWTVTERLRYSDIKHRNISTIAPLYGMGGTWANAFGGPGATLSYATGPNAGQVIADPMSLNGNGLTAWLTIFDTDFGSLDNLTNDVRLSRVWNVGNGKLTTTAGFYASRQDVVSDWLYTSVITGIRGDGEAQLLDITTATGAKITQDGFYSYNFALTGGAVRRSFDVNYSTNAPFGSVNYQIGKVAIGASARYDFGKASGSIYGVDLGGGRVGTITQDMNGDGIITDAETRVGVTPLTSPAPVDYSYGYLSYSTGINFRISEPLAVFARYSKGGRANADRILFTPIVSTSTGGLTDDAAAVDFVNQAEVGVKYRGSNLTLNLTGFWAKTEDTNLDNATGLAISREYKAVGLEFEGGYRWGPLSLTAGATYTKAEIVKDDINPAVEGNTPRHQADLIFQVTPQYTTERFSVGAVFIGTTESYAQDTNQLKMPGYVTTNAFVQVRPFERVQLSLNASNLFDKMAFVAIDNATIPADGIANVRPLNGRTISASVRFEF